jgi:FMN phosphatase YigB (HAD superfamily)
MMKPNLIVFDMDGVLIDVSRSYRETVRKTARLFFAGAKGFEKLPDPLFPLTDIAGLKQTGGLNNDWDLTAQAIHLLFALVKTRVDPLSPDDFPDQTIRGCEVSELANFLKSSPRPLMDLLSRYGRRKDPFVAKCFQREEINPAPSFRSDQGHCDRAWYEAYPSANRYPFSRKSRRHASTTAPS